MSISPFWHLCAALMTWVCRVTERPQRFGDFCCTHILNVFHSRRNLHSELNTEDNSGCCKLHRSRFLLPHPCKVVAVAWELACHFYVWFPQGILHDIGDKGEDGFGKSYCMGGNTDSPRKKHNQNTTYGGKQVGERNPELADCFAHKIRNQK